MEEPPSGPPPASASLEETRLKGHIGHLTRSEEKALVEFKKICAEKGFYTPESESALPSHDDGTLVRYLRARRFVPLDAFAQFKDTELWRRDNKLDALYEKIDIKDYQEARSVYPQWTGRRDKRGIPVYLYEVGKLDSKKMLAYTAATSKAKNKGPSPSRMLRLFALYENLTRFVMPLCSSVPGRPNPESPVDQSNNIVDISKVGLKQFWNLRSHMQDASQLATAHYPETLDRIFIIGAPAFFPTVWGWIKKWFDPITTSKIFILSHDQVKPTLSAFMDVSSIPKKYGGDLDFECGMMPSIDPAIRNCLSLKSPKLEELFLTGPTRWVDGDDGEMTALSVGSVDGQEHKEEVAVLHSWVTRVATGASAFPLSKANSYVGAIPQARPESRGKYGQEVPVSASQTAAEVQPAVAQPSVSSESEAVLPNGSVFKGEPVLENGQPIYQNGTPPRIEMPPPPVQRADTVYMTPASDPSELKQLQ
ncbi:MAG: hypothetical protein LQ351_007912 [Letrouitia transgressa]|nr:MAG: hypothetical protein LQ351_007912 [Letrouitia transgressa]